MPLSHEPEPQDGTDGPLIAAAAKLRAAEQRWHVVMCPVYELDGFLAAGWEPFAAYTDRRGDPRVALRVYR